MNNVFKFLIMVLAAGTFFISCDSDSSSSSPNKEIHTSVDLKDAHVEIAQSQNGNIFTFKAILSEPLKNRNLTYIWDVDVYHEGSISTSSDGKTFTVDSTKFPVDTYFVTLIVRDDTNLPPDLLETESITQICYFTETTFVVSK